MHLLGRSLHWKEQQSPKLEEKVSEKSSTYFSYLPRIYPLKDLVEQWNVGDQEPFLSTCSPVGFKPKFYTHTSADSTVPVHQDRLSSSPSLHSTWTFSNYRVLSEVSYCPDAYRMNH